MSSFWNFLFGGLLVLIWIVAGGFITQANVKLGSYKNDDDFLHRAYWLSFWAAFVTWTLIGIFFILVILSVLGVVALFGSGVGEVAVAAESGAAAAETGVEIAELEAKKLVGGKAKTGFVTSGVSWITIGFLIFALILVVITGILSAITASSIAKSPNYISTNSNFKNLNKSYTDSIIAASMCLGAGGLLIIGVITYFVIGIQRKNKIKTQKELAEKEQQLKLQQVQKIKTNNKREKLAKQEAFKEELELARQTAALQKIYQSS